METSNMPAYYSAGRYHALIVNQAIGKNGKGTPQFVLRCKILDEIVNDEYRSVRQQYERSLYLYLSDGAAEYTLKKLKSLGFDGTTVRQLDLNHPQACDFRNKEIVLVCKWEKYNGEDVEKWEVVWEGSGEIEDVAPLDAAEARKLD